MATGIVKGEQVGDDAITADVFTEEPFPLPGAGDDVALTYPNKVAEADILLPISHRFVTVKSRSNAEDISCVEPNAFIIADNYFGLKLLLSTLSGKVNLIYLDPPFATGMEFQSRQLKHAYGDKFGPATYIEFMRRRLILMRELLSDDGSIYLHIGHQMVFHLKAVLDEVFGRPNFRNLIVRRKCSSKNYTRNQYANLHDYILFYSKGKNYKWNQVGQVPTKDWIDKEYPKVDSKGRYKLVPIHAPGIRNGETGKPWRDMTPPPGKHWQYTPAKLDELDRLGEIYWSKNDNPRRKVYLSENKSIPLTDYWDRFKDAHHQSIEITGYPTEKNLDLLRTIVSASSNEGDLVVDPFAGSGTTLHAAHDLKRRWIGIDESLTAADASIRRMRRGISRMGDFVTKQQAEVVDLFAQNEQPSSGSPSGVITTEIRAHFDVLADYNVYANHGDEIQKLAEL